MSELTLDQLAAGIQAQFGAISDDISLLRAQVKQVRDTFLRSTLTDVETAVNTIDTTTSATSTTVGTINTTTGTINTTTGTINTGLGSLTPDTITPFSANSLGPLLAAYALAAPASATYPATNRAHYIPFSVTISRTVYQLYVLNGSAVSGNIDVGVYSEAGAKLISSGATAQAGTGVIQLFDVADTALAAGSYYMAVWMNNTTGTLARTTATLISNGIMGIRQETVVTNLPTTWTPTAATATAPFVPVMGLVTRSDFV